MSTVHAPNPDPCLGPPVPFCWYAERRASGLGHDDAVVSVRTETAEPDHPVILSEFLFGQLFPEGQCPECVAWMHA